MAKAFSLKKKYDFDHIIYRDDQVVLYKSIQNFFVNFLINDSRNSFYKKIISEEIHGQEKINYIYLNHYPDP